MSALLEQAIWTVAGDAVLAIGGALVALQVFCMLYMLLIGGHKPERYAMLGGRGVLQRPPRYGQE